MAASRDRDQLVDDANLVERLVQPDAVLVRHDAIGVAVDR